MAYRFLRTPIDGQSCRHVIACLTLNLALVIPFVCNFESKSRKCQMNVNIQCIIGFVTGLRVIVRCFALPVTYNRMKLECLGKKRVRSSFIKLTFEKGKVWHALFYDCLIHCFLLPKTLKIIRNLFIDDNKITYSGGMVILVIIVINTYI